MNIVNSRQFMNTLAMYGDFIRNEYFRNMGVALGILQSPASQSSDGIIKNKVSVIWSRGTVIKTLAITVLIAALVSVLYGAIFWKFAGAGVAKFVFPFIFASNVFLGHTQIMFRLKNPSLFH